MVEGVVAVEAEGEERARRRWRIWWRVAQNRYRGPVIYSWCYTPCIQVVGWPVEVGEER